MTGALATQDMVTPDVIAIAEGAFVAGSDQAEREAAYFLDEAAYGHDRTRQFDWYDRERNRVSIWLPAYEITRTVITNGQYALFIAATGHPAPDVDQATWNGYGLIHPFERSSKFAWVEGQPPAGCGGFGLSQRSSSVCCMAQY